MASYCWASKAANEPCTQFVSEWVSLIENNLKNLSLMIKQDQAIYSKYIPHRAQHPILGDVRSVRSLPTQALLTFFFLSDCDQLHDWFEQIQRPRFQPDGGQTSSGRIVLVDLLTCS